MRQFLNNACGTDVEAKGDLNKLHVKIFVNMSFRRMRHWVSRRCIKIQMLWKIQNRRQGLKKKKKNRPTLFCDIWPIGASASTVCIYSGLSILFCLLVWSLVFELQLVIWPQRRRERPCTKQETCWEARASITYLTHQMEPWPLLSDLCDLPIW